MSQLIYIVVKDTFNLTRGEGCHPELSPFPALLHGYGQPTKRGERDLHCWPRFESRRPEAPPRLMGNVMRIPLSLLILPFLLLASSWASADTLTWDDCVRIAALANPDLQAAQSQLRSSHFQERAAQGSYLPQLGLQVGSQYGDYYGKGGSTGSSGTVKTGSGNRRGDTNSAVMTLSQSLFSGNQIEAKVKQAQALIDSSGVNLDAVKAKVSFDLKSAAANLYYSQNYIKLSQDIMQRREENLRLVQLHFESGLENKGSLLLSKASLSEAQFNRHQAQQSSVNSQAQLARAIGRSEAGVIFLSGNIPVSNPPPPANLLDFVPMTTERRQALAQIAKAQAQMEIAKSALYPDLTFDSSANMQRGSMSTDSDRYTVGLNLSFPFYSGGRDSALVSSASADLATARSSLMSVEQQQLSTLTQAYNAFVLAIDRTKVDLEFVEAAHVRAEIARAKYNNGLLSFEDWDIIENDLINRQKASLLSMRDRVIAEATWEQALGKGVF